MVLDFLDQLFGWILRLSAVGYAGFALLTCAALAVLFAATAVESAESVEIGGCAVVIGAVWPMAYTVVLLAIMTGAGMGVFMAVSYAVGCLGRCAVHGSKALLKAKGPARHDP
jgi:uncharacterized membrane protein